jgi:hypothetical protein
LVSDVLSSVGIRYFHEMTSGSSSEKPRMMGVSSSSERSGSDFEWNFFNGREPTPGKTNELDYRYAHEKKGLAS